MSPYRQECCRIVGNERTWSKFKRRNPDYVFHVLKTVAGISDWPDQDSDVDDTEEVSLDDDPYTLRGKWLHNLKKTRPECLCECGFPTKDYVCKKTLHSKATKHCQHCCDSQDPRWIRFLTYE